MILFTFNLCHQCGPPEHIFLTHGFGNNLTITEFGELSTTLLYYLLPEKNAGLTICENGDDAHVSTYDRLLKYYKTTGNICVRFLNRILRDVKARVRKSQAMQVCRDFRFRIKFNRPSCCFDYTCPSILYFWTLVTSCAAPCVQIDSTIVDRIRN